MFCRCKELKTKSKHSSVDCGRYLHKICNLIKIILFNGIKEHPRQYQKGLKGFNYNMKHFEKYNHFSCRLKLQCPLINVNTLFEDNTNIFFHQLDEVEETFEFLLADCRQYVNG